MRRPTILVVAALAVVLGALGSGLRRVSPGRAARAPGRGTLLRAGAGSAYVARWAWRPTGDGRVACRLGAAWREVAQGAAGVGGPQEVRAPIPGKVVSVAAAAGARVAAGQPLLVLEAMKMENQLCAEGEGSVESVHVAPGDTVEGGQVLIVLGG